MKDGAQTVAKAPRSNTATIKKKCQLLKTAKFGLFYARFYLLRS